MRGFKKLIKKNFQEHGLGEEYYRPWFSLLGRVRSLELVVFMDILQESTKEELVDLTKNLNRKIEALKTGDTLEWSKIINEEEEQLVI